MAHAEQGSDEQAQFSWTSQWTRSARLSLRRKDRPPPGQSVQMLVFPWGFRWIDGDDEVAARWEDVTDFVYNALTLVKSGHQKETAYGYRLTLSDGRVVLVPGSSLRPDAARESRAVSLAAVQGVTTPVTIEQLGRLLIAAITGTQLPRAVAAYNAGQPVTFGPITVSQRGIAVGNKSLPWSEVQSVEIDRGWLNVNKKGERRPWRLLRIYAIPNCFVFEALVQAVLDRRSPAAG
jgi:hypothetical protein